MIVKCVCNNCPGQIEFEASELVEENSIVQCPHCGLDTKLFIPQKGGAKPRETFAKLRWKEDELELTAESVLIRKRGWANALASGLNGERVIRISSLTVVQMKPAGLLPGYILFSYAGSKPFMGGIWQATQDPDAFVFNKDLNEQAADFKAKVEQAMRDSKKSASSNNTSGTLTDELRKLAEFKNQGILSEQEFEAAKKKLLG